MLCLKVPKHEGEKVRNKLLEKDLLYRKGRIESSEDHDYLFLPLKEKPRGKIDELEYEVVEKDVEERKKIERDYTKLAEVPNELKDHLPRSFDIIGDIAIIKLPEEVKEYKREIGESILETQKNLTTVLEDRGVQGRFRIRDVKQIAGDKKTETVHREHGTELEVDVSEVYFSPRLATERWRVVKSIGQNESILDMFAGVGPYTVLIGKNVDVEHIHSVDLNPVAVKYLRRNVERNNISDKVTIYEEDARDVAPELRCDRIIMNLPHSSEKFIVPAVKALKEQGTIHYYEIIEEDEKEKSLDDLIDEIKKLGFETDVLRKREVRTYSATMVQMVYDLGLKKI